MGCMKYFVNGIVSIIMVINETTFIKWHLILFNQAKVVDMY